MATVVCAQTPGKMPLIEMEKTVVKAGLEKGHGSSSVWSMLNMKCLKDIQVEMLYKNLYI